MASRIAPTSLLLLVICVGCQDDSTASEMLDDGTDEDVGDGDPGDGDGAPGDGDGAPGDGDGAPGDGDGAPGDGDGAPGDGDGAPGDGDGSPGDGDGSPGDGDGDPGDGDGDGESGDGEWRIVASANQFPMSDIYQAASDDVWGVGAEGLLHFDGDLWSAVDGPLVNPTVVNGTGPNDVWIMGASGAAHWDGNDWTVDPDFVAAGVVRDMFVIATDDIWAMGSGNGVYHWDGNEWTTVPSPLPANASYVMAAGASATDIWFSASVGNDPSVLVRLYNGNLIEWTYWNPPVQLTGIGGPATNQIWAFSGAATAYRFDGTGWQQQQPPVQNIGNLLEIQVHGPTDWWILGSTHSAYWNGVSWTTRARVSGGGQNFWGASGGQEAWSVLTNGVTANAITRLHDGAWKRVQGTPLGGTALDMWGTSPTDVWVVGMGGISHYDGQEWAHSFTPQGTTSNAIWAAAEDDAWAGAGLRIYHWDGNGWALHTMVPSIIYDLWGSAPDDIWAAVGNGVWHYDGVTWSAYPYVNPGGMVFELWGLTHDHVWLCFLPSGCYRYDGLGWMLFPQAYGLGLWGEVPNQIWSTGGTFGSINLWNEMQGKFDLHYSGQFGGIYGNSTSDIWALGHHHEAYRYDGVSWSAADVTWVEERIWRDEDVVIMWGIDGHLFAGGQDGLVLQRP